MNPEQTAIEVKVEDQRLAGTLLTPASSFPGILFVHGWGGSQETDLVRAREIAALGCVCLTFDLRGHAGTKSQFESVTREQNLNDLIAAYDALVQHPAVDRSAIAIVGSSYGAYLAALLTSERAVRWLAFRVPALYRDDEWNVAKRQLDRQVLAAYRRSFVSPRDNRVLRACTQFRGDVLIIESEHDDLIPHETILSYRFSFSAAHSLTYRVISGADHALSQPEHQHAYTSLLMNWTTEMVLGSRGAGQSRAQASPPHVIS
ncbi:alpha/beta hydrolase family protein [Bradyrhizobium cenepequi]|uniref:alpha/beta hydrolase family protein n=1 Tax=Bradyrhizobium cenepequi TaxID=2821403 RepID=UPI001CE2A2B7|nr:alpha/beta fold hydrolase [Bradyrhizobium cenepequi]MCA6112728.1 alpha/beta fold hydrolase [Bradyrhizobium cenepequi]